MTPLDSIWSRRSALSGGLTLGTLATSLADNMKARLLLADGAYEYIKPSESQMRVRSQERFLEIAAQNAARPLADNSPPPIPFVEDRPAARRHRKRQTS